MTQDLEEVLAKIKAKEAEQANFAPGDEEPLHKKLALVDKKAVAGNRTTMLSANKTGEGRKSMGPDPYSRKRTVEKNYWSTSTDKVKVETKAEQQEQVEVKKVRFATTASVAHVLGTGRLCGKSGVLPVTRAAWCRARVLPFTHAGALVGV